MIIYKINYSGLTYKRFFHLPPNPAGVYSKVVLNKKSEMIVVGQCNNGKTYISMTDKPFYLYILIAVGLLLSSFTHVVFERTTSSTSMTPYDTFSQVCGWYTIDYRDLLLSQ